MGRAKHKNGDENLRGNLRKCQSESKHLKRQVARLTKQLAKQPIESLEEDPNDLELPDSSNSSESLNSCAKCGKAMILIDLKIRRVLSCKSCGTRITLKD